MPKKTVKHKKHVEPEEPVMEIRDINPKDGKPRIMLTDEKPVAAPKGCAHTDVESFNKNPRVYYPREIGTRCKACGVVLS